jgi:hypothetical protein
MNKEKKWIPLTIIHIPFPPFSFTYKAAAVGRTDCGGCFHVFYLQMAFILLYKDRENSTEQKLCTNPT